MDADSFERTTLSILAPDALLEAFNQAYEDYVVPGRMARDQLQAHVVHNDVALEHSPLWRDGGGRTVALGLLGVRGRRGWIGGFGVTLPFRGRGLGHVLLDAMLEHARAIGLAAVQLEVLTHNPAAIRVYERGGFVRTRDLRVLSRPATAVAPAFPPDPEEVTLELALPQLEALHPTPPCWQRERPSLRAGPGVRAYRLGPGEAPTACAVVRVDDDSLRLVDVAARDPEAAHDLVAGILDRHRGLGAALVNEPAGGPVDRGLEGLAFAEILRQHEMARA